MLEFWNGCGQVAHWIEPRGFRLRPSKRLSMQELMVSMRVTDNT